jgi:hypothetical protein
VPGCVCVASGKQYEYEGESCPPCQALAYHLSLAQGIKKEREEHVASGGASPHSLLGSKHLLLGHLATLMG